MNSSAPQNSSKTILVTGGAGYIGSHACKHLAREGWLPVAFDNLSEGHREAVKWGPLEIGDLADPASIDRALAAHRPIGVIHFAAYCYVGESVENPSKYYANNVIGTLNLLDSMRRGGVSHLVFSSTCATYGVPQTETIAETHPQNPINPYGTTKMIVERMLADFEPAYGLKSAALRYFNASGADPEGEIGEAHEPETHLIPLVLDAAMGRRKEISIFGEDYETPDGTCVRDYIHVSDLADAHLRAMKHLIEKKESLRLNLGTGAGYSVKQLIAAAERVTGRKIPVRIAPRRPGDPGKLVADASLARRTLGWAPQYADIETILAHAWAWHQKRCGGA